MSPTFRALRIRNYRLYTVGSVVSNTGTWMQRIAQDWLVLQLFAGSAAAASTALGITTGLQFLPVLLLSPYAGLVADRFPKRRLLQITQAWMGLTSLVLGGLALAGALTPAVVYLLVFLFGVGAAFDAPARQAFVSEMVGPDDLANAVGLNSASFNLAQLVGPALSGLLIAMMGGGLVASGIVIIINGVSYLAVISALSVMDVDQLAVLPRHEGPATVRAGLGYVRRRPDLVLVLTAAFFVGMFAMNFPMTSALMATHVFGKGAGEYGLLGTTLAIGSLTGALLSARRNGQPRLRLVIIAGVGVGLANIVLGLAPAYLLFALLSPLLGFATLTMLNAVNTTLQLSVTPFMRGRVMALYMMVLMGGMALGAPVVGWIAATFGARWTLLGGGTIAAVGILAAAVVFRYARPRHPEPRDHDRDPRPGAVEGAPRQPEVVAA